MEFLETLHMDGTKTAIAIPTPAQPALLETVLTGPQHAFLAPLDMLFGLIWRAAGLCQKMFKILGCTHF